jgi:hypothetical protein
MDNPPFINRSRWTDRNTIHAEIAFAGIYNNIVVIMFNRADRTCHFTGVTPYADLRINQMLFQRLIHHMSPEMPSK